MKFKEYVLMTKSFMVLNTLLLQAWIYCSIGDYMISKMEDTSTSIYQCNWYELPMNTKTNMNFTIMRAQSAVKFQAGNFVVVNLTNYMSLLRTAVSYLSVLRVMVEVD